MKGFLATFDTREYININNIQEVNTYCYNNIHNPDILLFRESKVTECIVLDYGADGFYIECSPELRKLFLNTRMTLKEFLNILKLATTLNDYELVDNSLSLNFNELLLNEVDKKHILEEVIYTISLSMNNIYDNLESVSFLVNNEEIYTINISDIK